MDEIRMGHGDALNKLALNERERVQRMLAKPLPRLTDGYMDSDDVASLIQCYRKFLPAEVEHGGHWLEAMGIKDVSPIPGRIFALEPFDRKTPDVEDARMEVLTAALNDLHELGCAAVPYSHPTRREGDNQIKQYGIFLPYMKLSADGKSVQRDLDGEAVFIAYLQDKGLLKKEEVASAYETTAFRDRIITEASSLQTSWAARR